MATGNEPQHDAPLAPSRFFLDETQLAAALALVGTHMAPQSPVAHIQPAAEPVPLLRNTALLDSTGRLIPEFLAALKLVADPKWKLSCTLNVAGDSQWKEYQFFNAAPANGPFVAFGRHDKEYEFTPLPILSDAVTHASNLLALPDLAAESDRAEIVLDLPAYAALLAGADAIQATVLRSRLARVPAAKPVFTPELLQNELEKALSHSATNWAAAAAHLLSPGKLTAALNDITNGMAALQSAGLIRAVQRGSVFTDTGEQVANAFTTFIRIAGFTLDVLYDGEWVKAAHFSLFVCDSDIWIASWSDLAAQNPRVRLIRASAAGAREQIRQLFEFEPSPVSVKPVVQPAPASAAEQPCSACGKSVVAGARFCSWCGSDLSVRQIRACPACGKVASNPNTKFCTGCGAKLDFSHRPQPLTIEPLGSRTQSRVASTQRRCPNSRCGKVVAADKKFCTSCGTPMPK